MRYSFGIILSMLLVTAVPEIASAHAFLDHSQPVDGAVVETAPTVVKLWFSRAIEPSFSSAHVVDDKGKQMDDGNFVVTESEPKLLQVGLKPLPAGKYKVIRRIVALDGRKAMGEFSFIVK
jgi:methionine-rich copper-binding protein CopC